MASATLGREHHHGRGRSAERPQDIPSRGWWDILKRVGRQLSKDRISIIAAGVAFYALFAVFPGLAALVSIYGLVFDPQQVAAQIQALEAFLPPEAAEILVQQLGDVSSSERSSLGLAAVGGILVALWSASKGVKTLMEALNVAYHEEEKRGFFRLNATALVLTLGAVLSAIVAIALIVALPAIITFLGLGRVAEILIGLGHLLLLGALMVFGMAVVFRFGPSRKEAKWRWVSPGALSGTVLWLAGSALFAVYVRNFANYNETYGAMGAVVILLTWFLLTAYAILIGAELNGEIERQTAKDTTESGKPLGGRGAYAADTVAG
ncbi:MAG TPA: YihY/virulence factor BrkB family protein [Burkholderiales bacterium]|nr:YihY/virulence factor BrkB family protein [Burkholderiales bacterium]